MKKRFFSAILAAALIFAAIPGTTAFAESYNEETSGAGTSVSLTVSNEPTYTITIPGSLNLDASGSNLEIGASAMSVGSKRVLVKLDRARSFVIPGVAHDANYFYLSNDSGANIPCSLKLGSTSLDGDRSEITVAEFTGNTTSPAFGGTITVKPDGSATSLADSGTYTGHLYFNIYCTD